MLTHGGSGGRSLRTLSAAWSKSGGCQPPRRMPSCPTSTSECHLQRQLHHARRKADIGGRDLAECSRACRNPRRGVFDGPTGNGGSRKGELRGIGDIVGFGTE